MHLSEKNQNIVTDIAGTTRDSLNTRFNKFGLDFYLVDTAGVRKKKKVHEDLEFYSVMRAVRAIEHSDVCILMIDVQEDLRHKIREFFILCDRNKKGIVILVNKWDIIDKDTNTTKKFEELIQKQIILLPIFLFYLFLHEKQRLLKGLETAINVWKNRSQKFNTSEL